MIFAAYSWLVVAAGIYMFLFTLANIIYMRVTGRNVDRTDGPLVSVLIPARNEEARILPALKALKDQSYRSFEVIVLDDNSMDDTFQAVRNQIGSDSRFSIVRGKPLMEGWKGKPYAMEQLTGIAAGEILLFMDADMRPGPDMISWTVTNLLHHNVDFLSGYVRHTTPALSEYLLFPVMYLATSFLLPLWLFRRSKTYLFSHVIGQYFCVRTGVLRKIGGFSPVKNKINEDIQMARFLKSRGFRQVFLDARKHLEGNMYDSMKHARMGIMRVVYEYFDNKIYPFVYMGVVIVTLLLLPIPIFLLSIFSGTDPALLIGIGISLVLAAWAITMTSRSLPWYVAFLYPVHFSWVIILSIHSIYRAKKGRGYQWKDRIVR